MRLTWFGGTTMRIHIGGAMLVMDAAGAPSTIDAAELVSGADRRIESIGQSLPETDAKAWKPRRPARLLDDGDKLEAVQVWKAGSGAVLVDASGEPPLLLVQQQLPRLGRWASDAVVVLFGQAISMSAVGGALLEQSPPKLLALAGKETDVDMTIAALRERLDGTGLVALEAGLALEV